MKPPKTIHWRIVRGSVAETDSQAWYALVDMATDEIERTHFDPRRLSEWALDRDLCSEVRHEYDLREAEEEDRARLQAAAEARAKK